jgi:ornithine lipid ester-linked acyl 2-hydroxylase
MKISQLASAKKRKIVHLLGKRFLRLIATVQTHCSTVPISPFLPRKTFTWIPELESQFPAILNEFKIVWKEPTKIPAFHQLSPDQARISTKDNWKTYAFFIFGDAVIDNCAQCEKTTEALVKIPNLQNAWFSILAPKYRIPAHRGPTKALIRCHLGLKIPRNRNECWLRVDNVIATWEEGKCLLFDDTFEHEVQNNTNEYRAVLFIDVERPMNKIGQLINTLVLSLMQTTRYVKDPIKNLRIWNKRLTSKVDPNN